MAASVHWLIQENQSDSLEVRAIVEDLELAGSITHLVSLRRGSKIPPIPDLPNDVPVICQGPAFVPRTLNYPHLRPGIFFDPATFCWSAFHEGWKGNMLATDGCVVPLSTARDLLRRGPAFVRPDADSKAFAGGVYDATEFAAATAGAPVNDATSVVVSSPIHIDAEWRFFIAEQEIVGCSEYRRWGRLSTDGSVPRAAIELAAESAASWSPAAVYCLDLAATNDRIGIVEANCFNASRFYGAAMNRIFQAVNAHVLGSG